MLRVRRSKQHQDPRSPRHKSLSRHIIRRCVTVVLESESDEIHANVESDSNADDQNTVFTGPEVEEVIEGVVEKK